jgi:hypothetical protein
LCLDYFIYPKFIYVVTNDSISFFLKAELYSVLYIWITFLFIHTFIAGHMSWLHLCLLWILLQRTWECTHLFSILISFPLTIYPLVVFLDNVVALFLIFWGTFALFSIMSILIDTPGKRMQIFLFIHTLQFLLYFILLLKAILTDKRWYLIVVLILIYLIICDFEHFHVFIGNFYAFWEISI